MARKTRKNNKTAQIAAPVRDFLQQIIRKKIRTPEERQALAKFLGQSPLSVSNLFKGEGSLDTWIAALTYCFDLDARALVEFGRDFQAVLRRYHPSESDRIAAQIDLPEPKRKMLFSAILTALTLEDESDRYLMAAESKPKFKE